MPKSLVVRIRHLPHDAAVQLSSVFNTFMPCDWLAHIHEPMTVQLRASLKNANISHPEGGCMCHNMCFAIMDYCLLPVLIFTKQNNYFSHFTI